ncbi:MAG TPA: family 20 glycosylhydrolase [Halalkalibaculum sp.]|nr:family 20 glycosylhydrolase [Halalkalibaculum sp.]
MRRIFQLLLIVPVLLGSSTLSFAQASGDFNPQNLDLTWELVENYHNDSNRYLSFLTLINRGDRPIPAEGWSLYMNNFSGEDRTSNFYIEQVNGDLNRLYPTAFFGGLQPGDSIRVRVLSPGSVLNISGAPIGFYWVWDSNTEEGHSIGSYSVKPVDGPEVLDRGPQDRVPVATPDVVFERNEDISDLDEDALPKVFPSPVEYSSFDGTFALNTDVIIDYLPEFKNEAEYLSGEMAGILGDSLAMTPAGQGGQGRKILLRRADTEAEGYRLSITPRSVTISASDSAGIFYGMQSLKTALPPAAWSGEQPSVALPAMEVSDHPRFGYRAFMQDVARNFQTKEQILKTLDLMSLYKLNVFHFHFNDDEGWRIEIPGLPELTEVGSRRAHTLTNENHLQPSHGSGPESNYPGSGYYSTEDFIEILEYATERHIKVIPEIETPGHARAAIKAMDARYRRLMAEGRVEEADRYLLQDLRDRSEYRSVQGWDDNVIDVSMPSTYRFLGKVIDELQAMYKQAGAPLDRIHMGGDEVPNGVWELSPSVMGLVRDNPEIESVGDLWGYFFRRVNGMLKERGLSLYGWEEIGMKEALWGGESHHVADTAFAKENVQVDVWNNVMGSGAEDLAYRLANAGYKVVLSGVSNFYFDLAYQKAFPEPGLYWGGFNSLDKPFSFIPYNYYKNAEKDLLGRPLAADHFNDMERLTDEGRKNIVGIQSLLWAEKLINAERQEYMLTPKLLAMAERAWAPKPQWAEGDWGTNNEEQYRQAWSEFLNVAAKRELPRLDHYAGGFAYRIPTPGAVVQDSMVHANVQMPGFLIRYTTDGSEPTADSKEYTGPFALPEEGMVRMKVFNHAGRGGRAISVK